ncbi:MAG: hypothetical protein ACR2N4_08475 [Jatrophihabitans sp.]
MRLTLLRLARQPVLADPVLAALAPASVHLAADAAGVDACLAELAGIAGTAGRRLVIEVAGVAGLNLVLTRLMRRGLLAVLDTALLITEPVPYLSGQGLPSSLTDQLALARQPATRLVGVIKDDSGGLCVDSAVLTPWPGTGGWWVRAMVDDQQLCDGTVGSISVRRLAPDLLQARVQQSRLRHRTVRGRSLQLACDPAQIHTDGVGRHRPRGKRTFWSEPALWRLALPDR